MCGWDPSGGTLTWALNDPAKKVPSNPRFDHTLAAYKGRFIYVSSDKDKWHGTGSLKSPDLDVNATNGACLSFWHFADHEKQANGDVRLDGGRLYNFMMRTNPRWNHDLVDFTTTPGQISDFCSFEPGYHCPIHQGAGNFASWTLTTADLIGVPDHTIKTLKGQYLYVNTTGVDSHHPVSRVFMPVRPPTEATCVTFWWRGRGAPSQLNVYSFTKETAMRDPLVSVSTEVAGDWWNVRTFTVSSRSRWNLVFEVVAASGVNHDSGVMLDDVEFSDGECAPYSEDAKFEVERAGSFSLLYQDHTTQSEDGSLLAVQEYPATTLPRSPGAATKGFVAIDDFLVSETPCDEMGRSTRMFNCGNNQTVPVQKVCDFVPDCKNAADEQRCGQCDFSESTCGWNTKGFANRGFLAWYHTPIGRVPRSPRTGSDERRRGNYLLLYSNITTQTWVHAAIPFPP
ncbi:hypothetical protein MTO96_028580 [Rhipicephalus appendiculatus]